MTDICQVERVGNGVLVVIEGAGEIHFQNLDDARQLGVALLQICAFGADSLDTLIPDIQGTTTEKENTMQPQVHVTPRKDSDVWDVQVTPLSFETQEDAIRYARAEAEALEAELVIHGEDGQIREKDSHGHDPKEIKG